MTPSRRTSSANYLFLVIGTPLVAFLIAASQAFEAHRLRVPLVRIGTSVAGLMLQAVPFMLLGAMMSAAVATLVTTSFIERHLPRTTIGGFTVALAAGLCMPVCDCMAVPTFANLLRKKLPVPCAVTFLVAVPIMNPMAIWSTWYAFPNDPWMVFRRVGLGALMALTAGMSFVVCPIGKIPVRPRNDHAANELGCACGCDDYAKCEHRQSPLRHFLRHTHDDFLRMMPILLVGSTIAAIISITFGNSINADIVANHPLGAIAMAMGSRSCARSARPRMR